MQLIANYVHTNVEYRLHKWISMHLTVMFAYSCVVNLCYRVAELERSPAMHYKCIMYTAVVSTALISNGTSDAHFAFITTRRTERLRDEIISYVRRCNIHVSVYFVSFLHLDAINQSCADRRAISYRQRVFLRTASRVLLIQSWPMSTIGRVCVFCVIRRAHSLPWILLTTSISKCFLGSSAAQRLL